MNDTPPLELPCELHADEWSAWDAGRAHTDEPTRVHARAHVHLIAGEAVEQVLVLGNEGVPHSKKHPHFRPEEVAG